MKILCSKCEEVFSSVIIDQDIAFKEVLVGSMKHCQKKHREQFELVGKAIAIAIGNMTNFMHLDEFCIVPEDEEEVQRRMEVMQETVMMGIGFDPEEEEDNNSDEELEEIPGEVLPGAGDPDEEETVGEQPIVLHGEN